MSYRPTRSLVTGASSGLGAAFARALAARGSDLILVARRADRLEALAAELRAQFGVAATVVARDLGVVGVGEALRADLAEAGPPDTIFNCAGFGTRGPFAEEAQDEIRDEVQVNIGATVAICRAFLPDLIAQRRGAIVNIASVLGYQPTPNMAVYGATKAFVLNFTEALWYETRATGVKVLAVSPGPTRTEFFNRVEGFEETIPPRVMQTPEQVVRATFRALDRRDSPPSVPSGALSQTLSRVTRLVPRRVAIRIAAAIG